MKNKLTKGLYILIITGYIIIIVSFFGNVFYFFDLFSHFYLQYLVLSLFLLIFSVSIKNKLGIIACLIVIPFLIFNVNKSIILNGNFEGKIDYYYMNANYFVNDPDSIIQDIKKYNPKYLIIVELNNTLHQQIIKKLDFTKVIYHDKNASSFGFYTNEEILNNQIHTLTYPIGEVQTKDGTLFIVHPFPPINNELSLLQKRNFGEIVDLFNKNTDSKKIIIGDFNSSFYSQVFKKYFGKLYYKPIYSWRVNSIFRIPIDYAIGNKDFFNTYSSNLSTSDHVPLLIKIKN